MDRVLAVPIIHHENVIGELMVANKPTDYDDKDRQLVESAAAFIAPILSARLQRDVEEKAQKGRPRTLCESRRDATPSPQCSTTAPSSTSWPVSLKQATSWFAVAMLDVNGLKATNDTYGHQTGDAVLKSVAGALSLEDAVAGRYGGDEFMAILPDADREAAMRYRREVLQAMASVDLIEPESGARVPATASIGLAAHPADARTLADLVEMSDSAMYAEKRKRPVDQAA